MPAKAIYQAPHLAGHAKERDDMDNYIRWFQRFIWLGIVMNMVFAIPALVTTTAATCTARSCRTSIKRALIEFMKTL
ncbi:MAG TPA: hypothetical protein DIW52_05070 [Pseudomonas sp.]|nr:hypothetical protein [Pseudomonas sp.]